RNEIRSTRQERPLAEQVLVAQPLLTVRVSRSLSLVQYSANSIYKNRPAESGCATRVFPEAAVEWSERCRHETFVNLRLVVRYWRWASVSRWTPHSNLRGPA